MRRVLMALVVAATLLGAGVQVASAAQPPHEVRVDLGTPVEQAVAWGAAVGPTGRTASAIRVTPADPDAVRIELPDDGQGTYRVSWSVLAVDGHPMAGTRAVVRGAARPVAPAVAQRGSDGPSVLWVIARFLVLAGVLGTLGMAATWWWVVGGAWRHGGVVPPGDHDADARRGRVAALASVPVRMWWRAWWALVGAWVAGLVLALGAQVAALDLAPGEAGTLLSDTRWGGAWLACAGLAALAVLAGVAGRGARDRPDPGTWRMVGLAAPGLLAAMALSWSGHAGTGTDATLGTAFDVLHAWATAAWLGGLLMLAVLAMPWLARMAERDRVALGAGVVVRFSAVAVAAVVILVVTGVYRALAELPSFDALWTTTYGVVLLVKLAIFAAMLALAAWNRFTLHPRLERAALGIDDEQTGDRALTTLRTSIRAEVVLAAAVLVAVAALVSIPPP